MPAFELPRTTEQAADPRGMAEVLAAQRPLWKPGSQHGYHALTFGWLAGELVRRNTGATVGEYTRRHLGADLHIGPPPDVAEEAARVTFPPAAQLTWSPEAPPIDAATISRMTQAYRDPNSLAMRASTNPFGAYNKPEVLTGGWPATGLVTTPRALATFYRDLTAGALLPEPLLHEAIWERVRGADAVLLLESAFALGYMLPCQNLPLPDSARPTAFGHPGAGGSLGLGDLDNKIAFAFIPNLRRDWLAGDRRAYRLVEAVYAAL